MTQEQQADDLIRCLLAERKEYQDIGVPSELSDKRRLLRSLMNVRPPAPVSEEFLRAQDVYLQERLVQRGVTGLKDLTPVRPGLYLWQGDITTLAAQIAIATVRDWQRQNPDKIEVIFNVFKDRDHELYKRLLG